MGVLLLQLILIYLVGNVIYEGSSALYTCAKGVKNCAQANIESNKKLYCNVMCNLICIILN